MNYVYQNFLVALGSLWKFFISEISEVKKITY